MYANVGVCMMTMKSYRKELWFNLPTRRGFANITPQVDACLQESGIQEGFTLVSAMHITASVFINDDESVCTRIMNADWSNSRHMSLPLNTVTMTLVKIMLMRI